MGHLRSYSSVSKTSEDATEHSVETSEDKIQDKTDEAEPGEKKDTDSHSPSVFQFQSLSGLFPEPIREVSNESRHTEFDKASSDVNMAPSMSFTKTSSKESAMSETDGLSKTNGMPLREEKKQMKARTKSPLEHASRSGDKLTQRSRVRQMKQPHATSRRRVESLTPPSRATVTNPFAQNSLETATKQSSEQEEGAWGIEKSNEGLTDTTVTSPRPTIGAFRRPIGRYSSAHADSQSPRLTHLTSSGEARMVDVGDKPPTKRVAIAVSTVSFSNYESARLITENNNKKGDVLGVARIAGIMAAKRTPDLIPLCHPLALSKVELDVKLEQHGENKAQNRTDSGKVRIMAIVECVGPTGVEMEAMTAVTVAGLTVVDMCKAVDKNIHITQCQVVYKSGGKSGLFFDHSIWSKHPSLKEGKKFFVQRGLELPGPAKAS